jgi:transketolase
MTPEKRAGLASLALNVRDHIIGMSEGGGCFIGASLSCADILTYLYASGDLRLGPDRIKDANRDYVLLSKGHDVPAMYGIFAELGIIERARLANHLHANDHIYWHPNRLIPGVEFHSGSLGHLISVGAGLALGAKLAGKTNKIVVILGDGELNEGSVWEACLVIAAKKLTNMVLIVDRNEFQANVLTEELTPLEPLDEKFESFGIEARRIDGHSFDELEDGWRHATRPGNKRPTVLIASTVRGKGVPSLERRADRWFARFTQAEVSALREELRSGKEQAQLTSSKLTVR